jgi:hypothetical protein
MTLKEFRPEGVTQINQSYTCDALLDKRMFYTSELAGQEGARFWLFKEKHHTAEDIEIARRYLKAQRDVVGFIEIIKNLTY